LRPDDYIVAYIGGFTSGRAILELIRATKLFKGATVLLVGDGHRREVIEAEIAIHPNVHYVGWVPQEQVSAYTALADVIYYAHESHSLNDGNIQFSAPNALFNAMAAGKPIITTNTGQTRYIVTKEQCGVIIDTATPEQVAQAMEKLCDPDVRSEMGRNARRAAETQYNWGQAQTILLDVYRQLEGTR
jgi:glycosyltransferase involved in cell wall biosynthesis